MTNTVRSALAALAALALPACAPDFVPGSVLVGTRIVAVAPDPPDAIPDPGPAGDVTVRARITGATGGTWTFCPLTAGPSAGYRCVAPACELPLGAGDAVTANPYARVLECLDLLGGLPAELGGELPETVETVFRLRVERPDGPPREAVARVPLYTTPAAVPAERNLPPAITGVEIAGAAATENTTVATARPGEAVPIAVSIDPASIQTYVDGAGRRITEEVVVSFYTTAGRFPDGEDRDDAPLAVTQLELRELSGEDVAADLYVVARDLRGGQAVLGPYRVAIERP